MSGLGARVTGAGRIYLVGGATAILHGWRETTIDIDLKADPEPPGFFEALAFLKDELDVNIELASPDQFIPPLPQWRERSLSIARHGRLDFFHYDPYGQVLSKLQRGYDRDHVDAEAMLARGLVGSERLRTLFAAIEPELIRYPALDQPAFRAAVMTFCDAHS